MGKRKQHYSDEFKREAVRLLKESGKTLHAQARALGISHTALWQWKEEFDNQNFQRTQEHSTNTPLNKDEEIRRLKRENDILKEERDFLKKATAFFAKESR